MKLGEYIKKYRDEHGKLSYRAFAALSSLSPQYISNLEKGINNDGKPCYPTMATIKKIAQATGVTETELLLMLDDTVTINPELSNREIILVQKQELIGHASAEMLRYYQDVEIADLKRITDAI